MKTPAPVRDGVSDDLSSGHLVKFELWVTRIVIVGGGSAGYEAALVAAARDPAVARVTVVDSDGVGGAAVLCDCVPSKTFIASTGLRTELRRATLLGFDIHIDDAKICLAEIHHGCSKPDHRSRFGADACDLSVAVRLDHGGGPPAHSPR